MLGASMPTCRCCLPPETPASKFGALQGPLLTLKGMILQRHAILASMRPLSHARGKQFRQPTQDARV